MLLKNSHVDQKMVTFGEELTRGAQRELSWIMKRHHLIMSGGYMGIHNCQSHHTEHLKSFLLVLCK